MGMSKMPEVKNVKGGKMWEHTFERFSVLTYVPENDLPGDIINYGFKAPYFVIFGEKKYGEDDAIAFCDDNGFTDLAKRFDTSVVFVYPTCDGGWKNAEYDLYVDLIKESCIHQYYKDGVVTSKNRFTGEWGECFIRGAKYRVYLYGYKDSADFIAKNYLKKVEGEFLWGPGEITPAVVSLEGLSIVPKYERRDIPTISVGNSDEINDAIMEACDHALVTKKADYKEDFKEFTGKYRRWCGNLEDEPDLAELKMKEVAGYEEVNTSPDNAGDDAGTKTRKLGYVAYYNEGLLDNGPVPTLFSFHGGGDSAMYIADISGWYAVAHKYNFLLISIENHINSTATEIVELIGKLKDRFKIDEKRIYASGFSMGGCKSWDLCQEYPEVFAALAPMDATFEVGLNVYGKPAPVEINRNKKVPIFYAGGEITPLPELPFQAEKCWDRMRYVFEINDIKTKYDVKFEDHENWPDKIWGISGDRIEKFDDPTRGSVLTLNYFDSNDGVCRTCFASISGQGHECRQHTCDHAWQFMSKFTR